MVECFCLVASLVSLCCLYLLSVSILCIYLYTFLQIGNLRLPILYPFLFLLFVNTLLLLMLTYYIILLFESKFCKCYVLIFGMHYGSILCGLGLPSISTFWLPIIYYIVWPGFLTEHLLLVHFRISRIIFDSFILYKSL